MRIHKQYAPNGELKPSVFENRDGGMSTDWEQYSTAQQARDRARKPNDNGIVKFNVGAVRSLEKTLVEHTPEDQNRAHSEVFGEKTTEIRLKLKRLAEWAIKI